jgi:uncharacterized protein with HEPN domain
MQHDPRAYLWDVQQAAEAIDEFTAGLDAARYAENALVRAAVERQFRIIGEALNRLSQVAQTLLNACLTSGRLSGFAMC